MFDSLAHLTSPASRYSPRETSLALLLPRSAVETAFVVLALGFGREQRAEVLDVELRDYNALVVHDASPSWAGLACNNHADGSQNRALKA